MSLARPGEMWKLKTVAGRERDLPDAVTSREESQPTPSKDAEAFIDVAATDP